ncbi:hypothetical protein OnM2_094053, partial [Erysiphe neolycopersici]
MPPDYNDEEIWGTDYRILAAEYSQRKRDLVKMAAYLWRSISQGYRDSLDKDLTTRQRLRELRELCKYSRYQKEAIFESDLEKLRKSPSGHNHDRWAQAWLGALIASKQIPDTVWTERRLYREFFTACLSALPSFGEKKMAEMIEDGDSENEFSLREAVRQYSAWASFSTSSIVASRAVFATLDGQQQDTAENNITVGIFYRVIEYDFLLTRR